MPEEELCLKSSLLHPSPVPEHHPTLAFWGKYCLKKLSTPSPTPFFFFLWNGASQRLPLDSTVQSRAEELAGVPRGGGPCACVDKALSLAVSFLPLVVCGCSAITFVCLLSV